jgi:hypothetical protein
MLCEKGGRVENVQIAQKTLWLATILMLMVGTP